MDIQEKLLGEYKYIHTGLKPDIQRIRIGWHITDWCNYNCPYCIQTCEHHYGSRPKETQGDIERLAYRLREKFTHENVTITLYGGEISHHFDMRRICEIMFRDNDCNAYATMLTNLSAPVEKYLDYLSLNNSVPGIRAVIIPSYQWSDADTFISKCTSIMPYMRMSTFQVTCVVWDGMSFDRLEATAMKFKSAGIPIRFTHGRIPGSGNKFYQLDGNASSFIKDWNNNQFKKTTACVTRTNGKTEEYGARSDILKEVADFEGLGGACFYGMTCFTGLSIMPSGNIRAGSCPDRSQIILGNINDFDHDFSVRPYRGKCECRTFCNLCNSVLIWNGEF